MEVSCKLNKKEMHVLPGHSCLVYKLTKEGCVSCCKKRTNHSRHSLSQDMCKQSTVSLQALKPSIEGCLKASQTFNSKQPIKLSSFNTKMDQSAPLDACEDSFSALEASLDDVSISESSGGTSDKRLEEVESFNVRHVNPSAKVSMSSNPRKDASSETISMLEKAITESGNGGRSCKHESMPSFLESLRKQELSLSNLTVSDQISLANISGKSTLLDIMNFFPQKTPVVCSEKKLLILDINGILADIVYPPPKGYKADTKIAGRAVYTRPFCSDFLKFCLERFNVAIWSSRSRKIIDRLINYLMGDMKDRLIFYWDLSHCTGSNFRTLENKHKTLVFKELRKVWERYDPDLPWAKGHFNESNTFLLDDTPYKALLNPPHTAIFPYSYEFRDHDDDALGPGGKIRTYLEELAVADDVQRYIEQHPFGQSAITERSLSWQFYDKVIKDQNAVPAQG